MIQTVANDVASTVHRYIPEGLWVQTSVMRQHSVESILQHQQTAIGLLLHGEEQTHASIQGCCGKTDACNTDLVHIYHLGI